MELKDETNIQKKREEEIIKMNVLQMRTIENLLKKVRGMKCVQQIILID